MSSRSLLSTDYDPNRSQYSTDTEDKDKGLSASGLVSQVSMEAEAGSHVDQSESEEESDSEDSEWDDQEQDTARKKSIWKRMRSQLKTIVDSKIFTRGILGAIVINTLSMGIEYHNQPETLTLVLEYSNIIFSALFALEMLLKVLAEGPFGYIQNGFNVFDGFIVILSVVELVQGGTGGLSVLRTFRLLRILKLVRFLPALRYQLVIMLRTMDNVATFFMLLILFIFIFSVLGMHLFGGKFCQHPYENRPCTCSEKANPELKCRCERKNFDTLLWSLVTVFQILTQEDWNEVLYNGMSKTSAWAALYFIALMTFGNYVLFNLLVAILVEGFSSEGEDEKKKKEEEAAKDAKEKEAELHDLDELKKIKNTNKLEDKELIAKLCKCKLSESQDQAEDIKNNKEKEKILLGLPPSVSVTKDDNVNTSFEGQGGGGGGGGPPGPLNPPIITHTAATPMSTPQGSPNETTSNSKDIKNNLAVSRAFDRSSLSIDSIDRTPSPLSIRSTTPRPSPKLHRGESQKGRNNWLNRFRSREDSRSLVDSQSDSTEEGDDESNRRPKLDRRSSFNNYSDCNGHAPLNNQRTLSPQNSVQSYRTLSPNNSLRGHSFVPNHNPLSRQNSLSSRGALSRQNSFRLSRQNSINSQNTLSPQNSVGSGPRDDYKQNNLSSETATPESKVQSEREPKDEQDVCDEEDEYGGRDCSCKWCPEPTGCFDTRRSYALYILHPNNRLRRSCIWLIEKKWFDYTVLFFIALNCITLAMERPDIPDDSVERLFLTVANYVFTVIFAFEMAVKVFAKGLFFGKNAYLKSGWNVMDGFLVGVSLVDVVVSLSASKGTRIFGILRVFRLLRTLRPLRVISRAPGLKLVVQTLLSSLRPIGNIVLICCTFFIIFGILGVQLFKGTFYYCEGEDVSDVFNKTDCQNKGPPYRWVNQKYNFDNLGRALMALFVLASKDGWVNIMYTGLDAVGVNQQPRENYSEWRLLYFISFLLLVGFFVLNMFVGVVVENFHKCRESQEKEEKARRAAKRAKKLERKRRKLRAPPYWSNYSKTRLFIHTVINSKYFDLAIAGVIGLNVITMALEYYLMPEELKHALKIFNFFFTSVFILEAIVKMAALGFIRYIKDRWNQLDIIIVMLSVAGIVLEEMKSAVIPINPTIIRVMRVLRIARVLKLLKMAKGIRALLDTVMQALPQVGNLGLLFFLLFFIFAALGVELFGRLECSEIYPCEGLSKHAHFQNFGMAFLTLFRVATGDNWNGIMKDTLREGCDSELVCPSKNCCVSPLIAPVFFVVFVLMAQFVLVNVVVAVLMKHLEESHRTMDEEADLEAEIQRELEVEVDAQNNNQDNLAKEKDDKEQETPFMGSPPPAKSTHLQPHKNICKQTSLPPDFTFTVCPPSPYSCTGGDISQNSSRNSPSTSKDNVRIGKRKLLKLPLIRIDTDAGSDSSSIEISFDGPSSDFGNPASDLIPPLKVVPPTDLSPLSSPSVRSGSPRPSGRSTLSRQDAVSNNSSPTASPMPLSPVDSEMFFSSESTTPNVDQTHLSADWSQHNPKLMRSVPNVGTQPPASPSWGYPLAMDPNPVYLRHRSHPSVHRSRSLKLDSSDETKLNKKTSLSEPGEDPSNVNINMFDPFPCKERKLKPKVQLSTMFSPRQGDQYRDSDDLYDDPELLSESDLDDADDVYISGLYYGDGYSDGENSEASIDLSESKKDSASDEHAEGILDKEPSQEDVSKSKEPIQGDACRRDSLCDPVGESEEAATSANRSKASSDADRPDRDSAVGEDDVPEDCDNGHENCPDSRSDSVDRNVAIADEAEAICNRSADDVSKPRRDSDQSADVADRSEASLDGDRDVAGHPPDTHQPSPPAPDLRNIPSNQDTFSDLGELKNNGSETQSPEEDTKDDSVSQCTEPPSGGDDNNQTTEDEPLLSSSEAGSTSIPARETNTSIAPPQPNHVPWTAGQRQCNAYNKLDGLDIDPGLRLGPVDVAVPSEAKCRRLSLNDGVGRMRNVLGTDAGMSVNLLDSGGHPSGDLV